MSDLRADCMALKYARWIILPTSLFTSIKTNLTRSLLYALVLVELVKWIGLAQLYIKC